MATPPKVDQRCKDYNWAVRLSDGNNYSAYNSLHLAVLMDIRDELKRLNSLLYCDNFYRIPNTLRQIEVNTNKAKRKKK